MSIVSLGFITFVILVSLLYFIVPKKNQWIFLLLSSLIFFLLGGLQGAFSIIFILLTSIVIHLSIKNMSVLTVQMNSYLEENKDSIDKNSRHKYKSKIQKQRKSFMLIALVTNLAFLIFFKYSHFIISQINDINSLFGLEKINNSFQFLIPLGISFYTFQSTGYLLDVYWDNVKGEKNYFKNLLFISFFPQIVQGPISKWNDLSKELFKEHSFEYKNYVWGLQRMLWGFFKKMVIADQLNLYVGDLFSNYSNYSGISVFIGMLFYSFQIYADFSGYMDIMCGFCEMLGIHLTENFKRPYFSKSVTEYWRRWHISLGTWFKSYLYYPIGTSNWSRKLAKKLKSKLGRRASSNIPATIALVLVWLATGLWHGANWAYATWGLLNGLFIIASMWVKPFYEKVKGKLRIDESRWSWRAFQVIRTFILVTFIKVLPEVGTLSDGFGVWKQVFIGKNCINSFNDLLPFVDFSTVNYKIGFVLAIFGVFLMFIFSLIERQTQVRTYFNKLPSFVRWSIYTITIFVIAVWGVSASWGSGGFMYAKF